MRIRALLADWEILIEKSTQIRRLIKQLVYGLNKFGRFKGLIHKPAGPQILGQSQVGLFVHGGHDKDFR
jgi:hypothetical protein